MNTREKGAQKEQQVCAYLLSEGVEILERNFRARQGEIDVIGRDGSYLVFFEVKYRAGAGRAVQRRLWEALSREKSVRWRIITDCVTNAARIPPSGSTW